MSQHRSARLLIVDMDNTLYDWVEFFVPAFYAMVGEASRLLNVGREQLLDELQRVHQNRGSSEHPFALLETHTVLTTMPDLSERERHDRLQPAFDAFNEVRARHLRLYDGVRETLLAIRQCGCSVIAHTESTSANIAVRVKLLGLDDLLDEVFAPPFIGAAHPVGDLSGRSSSMRIEKLPEGVRKPDPAIPRDIAHRLNVPVAESLYVGDSLANDVAMAQAAGMQTAWARYGTQHSDGYWEQLVRVTHWSPSVVARSSSAEHAPVTPDVILDSFGELLTHFAFARPNPSPDSAGTMSAG